MLALDPRCDGGVELVPVAADEEVEGALELEGDVAGRYRIQPLRLPADPPAVYLAASRS